MYIYIRILPCSWLPTENYYQTWQFGFFPQIWRMLTTFSWKIFHICWNFIFQIEIKRKSLGLTTHILVVLFFILLKLIQLSPSKCYYGVSVYNIYIYAVFLSFHNVHLKSLSIPYVQFCVFFFCSPIFLKKKF
jgi:uncharacterized membrane protein YozB (DUF420 family)